MKRSPIYVGSSPYARIYSPFRALVTRKDGCDADYDHAKNYWKVTKSRLIKEGNESVTKCNQLK